MTTTIHVIHGLESHAGWFIPLATELSAYDIALRVIDRVPRDRADAPEDWLAGLQSMSAESVVLAHSWGAKLLAFALSKGAVQPSAIILLTPAFALQSDLSNPANWMNGQIPILEDRYSSDLEVQSFLKADQDRLLVVKSSFLKADRQLSQSLIGLHSIAAQSRTLSIVTANDRIVDPNRNEELLSRMFPTRDRESFDDHGHLILLESPATIAATIAKWLNR